MQERHIVLSDYHVRTYRDHRTGQERKAHDPAAMKVVEKFMAWWRPTHEWLNGDIIDAHQVSRFCRDPRDVAGLAADLDEVSALADRHAHLLPDTRRHFDKGNHDVRMEHYIAERAPALVGLKGLSFRNLMGLDQSAGWDLHEYGERVVMCEGFDIEITHGNVARKNSGATALAEMKGYSGISGHTHRLGHAWKTDRRGTISWIEGGCLCSLTPDYCFNPDWQQGFVTVTFYPGTPYFELTPVQIHRSGDARWLCFAGRVVEV